MAELFSSTPITSPELYTYILLDGARSPGLCRRTSGGDRTQQEQDQQAPGFAGGFTVFRFQDISKLEYEFRVRDVGGYRALESWAAGLNTGAAKRPPKAYKFTDPWLRHNGIGVVAVLSVGPIEQPTPGALLFTLKVKWTEYKRMQPIGGPVSPKPTNEWEQKVADQKLERKALADHLAAVKAAQAKGK